MSVNRVLYKEIKRPIAVRFSSQQMLIRTVLTLFKTERESLFVDNSILITSLTHFSVIVSITKCSNLIGS